MKIRWKAIESVFLGIRTKKAKNSEGEGIYKEFVKAMIQRTVFRG